MKYMGFWSAEGTIQTYSAYKIDSTYQKLKQSLKEMSTYERTMAPHFKFLSVVIVSLNKPVSSQLWHEMRLFLCNLLYFMLKRIII